MFEFHGWINIIADDTDDADISIVNKRRKKLCLDLKVKIKEIEWCNGHFKLFENVNGASHLIMTGESNHRQNDVIELFYCIAKNQPFSYGLLHIRDDEDHNRDNNYENVFRVFALRKGTVIERTEKLLSPCIPVIEDEFIR